MDYIKTKSGIGLIAVLRAEQVFKHSRTIMTDSNYYSRDVFQRAAVAIIHSNRKEWPDADISYSVFNHIITKDRTEQIAHAAAFLAAEIDYLEYKEVLAALQRSEITKTKAGKWIIGAEEEMRLLTEFLEYCMEGKMPGMPNTLTIQDVRNAEIKLEEAKADIISDPTDWYASDDFSSIETKVKELAEISTEPYTNRSILFGDIYKILQQYRTIVKKKNEGIPQFNNASPMQSIVASIKTLEDVVNYIYTDISPNADLIDRVRVANTNLQYLKLMMESDMKPVSNVVKSESVQDLYTTWLVSDTTNTFETWLLEHAYINRVCTTE